MGTRHPSPPVQGVPWHPRQGMLRGMTAGTGCSDTLGSPKAPPPFLHTWVPPLCLSFPKRSQTPEPRSTFIDSKQRLAPVPQGDSSIPLGGGGAWGGQQCHPVPRRLLSSSCTRWQRARRRAGSSGLRAHTRRVTSSALSPCGTLSLAVPPRQHPRCPTAPHGSTVFPPPHAPTRFIPGEPAPTRHPLRPTAPVGAPTPPCMQQPPLLAPPGPPPCTHGCPPGEGGGGTSPRHRDPHLVHDDGGDAAVVPLVLQAEETGPTGVRGRGGPWAGVSPGTPCGACTLRGWPVPPHPPTPWPTLGCPSPPSIPWSPTPPFPLLP